MQFDKVFPGFSDCFPHTKPKAFEKQLKEVIDAQAAPQKHSMHTADIPKGTYGYFSKIKEEFLEAEDANKQGLKIVELWELADLVGSIRGYLARKYQDTVTIHDLIDLAVKNRILFETGARKE